MITTSVHPFRAFIFCLMIILFGCTKNETTVNQSYTGWAVGGVSGGYGTIINSQNDGMAWNRQANSSLVPDAFFMDVNMVSTQQVWAVGSVMNGYGLIMLTTDGGLNWIRKGSSATIPNVQFNAVCAIDANTVWVAGSGNYILSSQDNGTNWIVAKLDTAFNTNFTSITKSGTNNIWVTGEPVTAFTADTLPMIFHSSDAGVHWTRQGAGDNLTGTIHNIFAVDDSTLYAAADNFVYKSSNGGRHWSTVFALPGQRLNAVCAEDVNNVWAVGNNDAIFHSKNSGLQWDTIHPQLTGNHLTGITCKPSQKVWIVGAPVTGTGKGILLYTNNDGETWFIPSFPSDAGLAKISFGDTSQK
jgi:photosystem II stability/assembly factor-like uncharacterized protein